MQRSRRALLRRTAAAQEQSAVAEAEAAANGRKRRLYGFSASLVVASWVAVLLLHSLVGHGDSQRDGGGYAVDLTVVEPALNVGPVNPAVQVEHGENLAVPGDTRVNSVENAVLSEDTLVQADQLCSNDEVLSENTEALTKDSQVELSGDQGGYLPQSDVDSGVQPGEKVESEDLPRPPRLSRVAPPDLDEFKTRAIAERGPGVSSQPGHVIHRREPSGKLYNYAAASKGAKVLDFNKEAKGASNILDKDKDKYLRNPCSAEGKFVIIELSEETLVDTIAIANFEHYSSNPKEFELLSSLTYPTENWETLGRFTAANAKVSQNFTFLEPKWARYLKLNLVSHYGSEFYCTLSMLEVYGMDAVEKMLENLIPVENKKTEPDDKTKEPVEQMPLKESSGGKESSQEPLDEDEFEIEDFKPNSDSTKNGANDQVSETRTLQAGRIPGDTVLKMLMQKVQSLDVSFSVLEKYLVELNSRYGQIFKDFDADIDSKDVLLERIKSELKNLESSKDSITNEIEGILSWKLVASSQLNQLVLDNALLRSEFETFRQKQTDMENRSLAVIFLSFVFACLALAKLSIGIMSKFCRFYDFEKIHNLHEVSDSESTIITDLMQIYSAVVWRHQLSQFGGPFKAAADQTTGSRIFCPCSTPGPGECKADLPGKHVYAGILLDRCASLFVQGTRGPEHGPRMAFMLPCMIGMGRWVNILLVSSFHEHCAVHVLQLAPCLVHMAWSPGLLKRQCSVGFQQERHR